MFSPPCARESSWAPRQTPSTGISRATASRSSSASSSSAGSHAACSPPRLTIASDVEVRQRAEVLLDRAERLGGVAEERLGQMVDDGDARVSRWHGRGQGWTPERPQAPPRDDDLARRRDRRGVVRRLRRRDQPDRAGRGALLSCRRRARDPRDADAGRDGGRASEHRLVRRLRRDRARRLGAVRRRLAVLVLLGDRARGRGGGGRGDHPGVAARRADLGLQPRPDARC